MVLTRIYGIEIEHLGAGGCVGELVLWIEGLCVGFACCMALDDIDGSI